MKADCRINNEHGAENSMEQYLSIESKFAFVIFSKLHTKNHERYRRNLFLVATTVSAHLKYKTHSHFPPGQVNGHPHRLNEVFLGKEPLVNATKDKRKPDVGVSWALSTACQIRSLIPRSC